MHKLHLIYQGATIGSIGLSTSTAPNWRTLINVNVWQDGGVFYCPFVCYVIGNKSFILLPKFLFVFRLLPLEGEG